MVGLLTGLGDRAEAPPGGTVPPGTFFAGSVNRFAMSFGA